MYGYRAVLGFGVDKIILQNTTYFVTPQLAKKNMLIRISKSLGNSGITDKDNTLLLLLDESEEFFSIGYYEIINLPQLAAPAAGFIKRS